MKCLITGSAGFVFSNIVIYSLIHTDWTIISVDKLTEAGSLRNLAYNPNIENRRHRLHIGDISNYEFVAKIFDLERPDIVINGAAASHVDNSINSSAEFVSSNVVGTHSMLEAARNTHCPSKFIQFSTDEVFGQIKNGSFNENSPLNPRNPYSATKASADLLCGSYINTYNLPIIITRCCNIFGGRQNKEKLIPKTISNILNNNPIPVYGRGLQKREWIYIMDVFRALRTIISSGETGNIYNIGSGYETSNIDLVKNILDIMNADHRLIKFVKDRPGHDFRYALDHSKLESLGWQPKESFDEALKHTIEWYKKNTWSWK